MLQGYFNVITSVTEDDMEAFKRVQAPGILARAEITDIEQAQKAERDEIKARLREIKDLDYAQAKKALLIAFNMGQLAAADEVRMRIKNMQELTAADRVEYQVLAGNVFRARGRYSDALKAYKIAGKKLKNVSVGEIASEVYLSTHIAIEGATGVVSTSLGRFEEALSHYSKQLDMIREQDRMRLVAGDERSDDFYSKTSSVYSNMGEAMDMMQRFSDSRIMHEQATSIYLPKISDPSLRSEMSSWVFGRFGTHFRLSGDCSKAVSQYDKALKCSMNDISTGRLQTLKAIALLMPYKRRSSKKNSEAWPEKMVNGYTDKGLKASYNVPKSVLAKAQKLLEEALHVLKARGSHLTTKASNWLARLHWLSGKVDEALLESESAVILARNFNQKNEIGFAELTIGLCRFVKGIRIEASHETLKQNVTGSPNGDHVLTQYAYSGGEYERNRCCQAFCRHHAGYHDYTAAFACVEHGWISEFELVWREGNKLQRELPYLRSEKIEWNVMGTAIALVKPEEAFVNETSPGIYAKALYHFDGQGYGVLDYAARGGQVEGVKEIISKTVDADEFSKYVHETVVKRMLRDVVLDGIRDAAFASDLRRKYTRIIDTVDASLREKLAARRVLDDIRLVPLEAFLKHGKIPHASEGLQKSFRDLDSPNLKSVFVSHRWLRPKDNLPDNEQNEKYQALCASLKTLCEKERISESDVAVWIDLASMTQDDYEELVAGVFTLPVHVFASNYFLCVENKEYFQRPWCLVEWMFAAVSHRTRGYPKIMKVAFNDKPEIENGSFMPVSESKLRMNGVYFWNDVEKVVAEKDKGYLKYLALIARLNE